MTTINIEARALALHEDRKNNTARRSQVIADMMSFTGAEREFCLSAARSAIAEEAHQVDRLSAEDRWYADQIAAMSDEQIAIRISRIDDEVSRLPYRSLTVNIADRGAELAVERRHLVAEQTARAVPALMAAE